ncbi:hypothetical protein JW998_16755 [candidate division KSB1 bacterium]|nr:hypothetical protein [candidate division KSB1 bacterium]
MVAAKDRAKIAMAARIGARSNPAPRAPPSTSIPAPRGAAPVIASAPLQPQIADKLPALRSPQVSRTWERDAIQSGEHRTSHKNLSLQQAGHLCDDCCIQQAGRFRDDVTKKG